MVRDNARVATISTRLNMEKVDHVITKDEWWTRYGETRDERRARERAQKRCVFRIATAHKGYGKDSPREKIENPNVVRKIFLTNAQSSRDNTNYSCE